MNNVVRFSFNQDPEFNLICYVSWQLIIILVLSLTDIQQSLFQLIGLRFAGLSLGTRMNKPNL